MDSTCQEKKLPSKSGGSLDYCLRFWWIDDIGQISCFRIWTKITLKVHSDSHTKIIVSGGYLLHRNTCGSKFLDRGYELLLCEAGHLEVAMSKCRKSAGISKLESCCWHCTDFRKNLVFHCFLIYLPDLRLSNDPKIRLFHWVHGMSDIQVASYPGQVPDYVQ